MGIDSVKAKATNAAQQIQNAVPPPPPPPPPPAPEPVVAKDEFIAAKKSSSSKLVLNPEPTVTTTEAMQATGTGYSADPNTKAKEAEADYRAASSRLVIDPNAHQQYLALHSKDPYYQQRYIQLLNQNGELATEADKAFATPSPQVLGTTTASANFTKALSVSRGLTVTEAQIKALAQNSDGMFYAARKLSPPVNVGATAPSVAKTTAIETATTNYANARSTTETLNQQLAAELSALGPALTDEQRAEYTRLFKANHSTEYANELTTAQALADTLAGIDPTNAAVASKLYAGYTALAQGPLADKAAGWIDTLKGDPALSNQYAQAMGLTPEQFTEKLDTEIRDPAVATMMTNAMAAHPEDPASARKEFFGKLDTFKNLKDNIDNQKGYIEAAFDGLEEYAKTGRFDNLARLTKDFAEAGHFGRAVGMVMIGAGLGLAYSKGKDGDYVGMLKESLGAAQSATEMLAGATKYFSNATKTPGLATFAAKAAPWLGVAANTASFFSHLQGARAGSEALAIAALGDVVAVAGNLMVATGVGAPVGVALTALGTVISTGGELWHGFSEQQRSKDEQIKILGQMGFKRPEVLADNRENLERLQLAGGFSPQQLQQISERYPAALDGSYNPSLAKLISSYNLAGENALAFLDKLNTEAGGNLGVAMQSLPVPSMNLTDEEWRASIDRLYPKTAQWARGLNMYAGQNAQPTMPNASGEY